MLSIIVVTHVAKTKKKESDDDDVNDKKEVKEVYLPIGLSDCEDDPKDENGCNGGNDADVVLAMPLAS